MINPLIAIQASPGIGKSFFFDLLASLSTTDSYNHLFPSDEVKRLIKDAFAVRVTYNSNSPLAQREPLNPETGLSLCLI